MLTYWQMCTHGPGGCLEPVNLLQEAGVTALVTTGVGAGPMQGLDKAGITVYYADMSLMPDVRTAVTTLNDGGLPIMRPSQACQGEGNCQH